MVIIFFNSFLYLGHDMSLSYILRYLALIMFRNVNHLPQIKLLLYIWQHIFEGNN